MSTGPRRLLVTALLSLLVGLGVLKALFGGRRQQPRSLAGVEELVPLSNPPPGQRAGGRRGLAAALVLALLLTGLAGIVYESRDALFGVAPRRTDGSGSPLANLAGPETDAGHKPGARPSPAPTPEAVPLPKAEAPGASPPSAEAARQAEAAPVSPQAPPAPSIPAVREPSFDIVRVDPNGDALVAGRAAPDSTVDLLVDGKPVASAKADAGGWFTFMPTTLPTGSSEIGLRATDAQGAEHRSPAKVAVVVAPSRDEKPLVAVTSPGQPTLVLSQPDRPPATRPGAVAQSGGPATIGSEATPSPDATRGADRSGSARTEAPVASGTGSPETAPTPERDSIATGRNRAETNRAETDRAEAPAGLPRTADRTDPTTTTTTDATPSKETPPKIVSIDAQEGGRLFVTARGAPGAAMRLYLNDTLIAPATVGRDGTVTFTIGQGVRPGAYKVRLDLVDSVTGKVRDRAEVPFAAPAPGRDDGVEYAAGPPDSGREIAPPDASLPPGTGTAQARRDAPADRAAPPSSTGSLAAQTTTVPGGTAGSSEVYVPGIETARIVRGDSLWKISRRTYGEGLRYTLIYDANQDQIRDPDLIYPGQVFVLPGKGIPETAAAPEGTGPRE